MKTVFFSHQSSFSRTHTLSSRSLLRPIHSTIQNLSSCASLPSPIGFITAFFILCFAHSCFWRSRSDSLFCASARSPLDPRHLFKFSHWDFRISVCFCIAAVDVLSDSIAFRMSSSKSGRILLVSGSLKMPCRAPDFSSSFNLFTEHIQLA